MGDPVQSVSNTQLYLALGVPLLFNPVVFGLVVAWMNAEFESMTGRFDSIDRRFYDMRDLWPTELHRVEEVLDARMKHLEN